MRLLPRSIRFKVLYTMLAVVLLSGVGFLLVLSSVVRSSFSELETTAMHTDAGRVRAAIDSTPTRLVSVAGDWARWDDTYEFLEGTYPEYPQDNLGNGSIDVLGVDFMAYLDRNGRLYHISAVEPETREPVEPSAELGRRIEELYRTVYLPGDNAGPLAGHAMLPDGPASVVITAVTNNDGTAPSNGALVTGAYIKASEIADIEHVTALDVDIVAPQGAADVPGVREPLEETFVSADGPGIASRSTLRGIDGNPALTFTVREQRLAMQKANSTVSLVALGMLGVVMLSSLTMAITLDRMVNRRLTRLYEQVAELPSHAVADRRVTVEGDDEISAIAQALNVNFEGLAEAEAALKHAADHDYLTGLANRRRFEQDVEKALAELDRKGGTLAWVLMDLDGFKAINDTRGHDCGDLVLEWFAHLLMSEVRRYSTIARLGGDEFAILLPHSDEYDAAVVADRLLTALSELQCEVCEGEPFMLNASVGIAVAPNDGTTVGELSRAADNAMYTTKVSRTHDSQGAH